MKSVVEPEPFGTARRRPESPFGARSPTAWSRLGVKKSKSLPEVPFLSGSGTAPKGPAPGPPEVL